MQPSVTNFHILLFLALQLTPTSGSSILLSSVQEVSGFTPQCEAVYNAPIFNCSPSDFPRRCSDECQLALARAQAMIDNACAGQNAALNSVIGLMFNGTGDRFMCTANVSPAAGPEGPGSSPSSSSSSSSSSSKTSTHTTHTSSAATKTSTLSALTSTSGASSTSTPGTLTTSTSAKSAKSSTFLSTAFNNGQATTLTSASQRTSAANSNPDAFGGGGSPFEIGPNAGNTIEALASAWLMVGATMVGVLMMMR